MNKVLVTLLLTLGITGMAQAAGDAKAGQAKAAMCGACHGADGNSAAPNFPKLAGQGERYLLKQMNDIKSGNRNILEMTGLLDQHEEQDMADIAAYFASQNMSVGAADPALVKAGEALFRGGKLAEGMPACTGCHSPNCAGQRRCRLPAASGWPACPVRGQAADRLPRRQPYQRRRQHDDALGSRQAVQQGHPGDLQLHPGSALIPALLKKKGGFGHPFSFVPRLECRNLPRCRRSNPAAASRTICQGVKHA